MDILFQNSITYSKIFNHFFGILNPKHVQAPNCFISLKRDCNKNIKATPFISMKTYT